MSSTSTSSVTERPLLCTPDVAQRIWEGLQWQDRRPVLRYGADASTQQPARLFWNPVGVAGKHGWCDEHGNHYTCPFGEEGDVLYVREAWQAFGHNGKWWHETEGTLADKAALNWDVFYRGEEATAAPPVSPPSNPADVDRGDGLVVPRWLPSIHMPKWASRMRLRVKRVWVERVQEISVEGILAEGCRPFHRLFDFTARAWFQKLWDDLYGNWDDNPWVWCCEFEPPCPADIPPSIPADVDRGKG